MKPPSFPASAAAAVLEGALQGSVRCKRTLACRGHVCRVELFVPEGAAEDGCFTPSITRPQRINAMGNMPRDYFDRTLSLTYGGSTPVRDPATGESLTRVRALYHRATLDATPVPFEERPAPPLPMAGRHRQRLQGPRLRSPACQAEVTRLEASLATLETQLDEFLPIKEAFPLNDDNPELVPEVTRELARLTGLAGDPFPLSVECRGPVCLVRRRSETEPTKGDGESWYSRLESGRRRSAIFADVRHASAESAYVRVRALADRNNADPRSIACELGRKVAAAAVFESCRTVASEAGTLRLVVRIAGPGEPDRALAFDAAGSAAGTSLGRCVVDRVRAVAATIAVPQTWNSLVAHAVLELPGATSLWRPERDPCD